MWGEEGGGNHGRLVILGGGYFVCVCMYMYACAYIHSPAPAAEAMVLQ